MSLDRPPLVLVSVGTDHHPFDRLVEWVQEWVATRPPGSVRCVLQSGSSRLHEPGGGQLVAVPLLGHERLVELMREASVVVCHAGPSTITQARACGHRPLVVPRDPGLGEHVDDHQQLFAARMGAAGLVELVIDRPSLHAALDRALAGEPSSGPPAPPGGRPEQDGRRLATARTFGALLGRLLGPDGGAGEPVPRVVLIGGAGRSGSTLVERLLGSLPGTVPAGELVHLWERGVGADELCGCGTPLLSCAFWTKVAERAYGGWDQLDLDWVLDTRWTVDRNRRLPFLLAPGLAPARWRRRLRLWVEHLESLYRALAEVGDGVVLDSSKHLSYALLLHRARVELSVLVVVRDPRAVAHSWASTRVRPEVRGGQALMPRYSALKSSVLWVLNVWGYRLLSRLGVDVQVVRYEQLCQDPAAVLARIADRLHLPGPLPELTGSVVDLPAQHTCAGNPMRLRTGPVTIAADQRWQQEMPAGARALVTLATAPWLRAAGYRLRGAGVTGPGRPGSPG